MSKQRYRAMVERCRKKGGDCPCGLHCEAEIQLCRKESELQAELKDVRYSLRWLRHKPCTIKEDWETPEKPLGDYQLTVVNEGDGWCLHWYSETEDNDYIEITGDAAWPFNESVAWEEDWEALGVEVA